MARPLRIEMEEGLQPSCGKHDDTATMLASLGSTWYGGWPIKRGATLAKDFGAVSMAAISKAIARRVAEAGRSGMEPPARRSGKATGETKQQKVKSQDLPNLLNLLPIF